MRVKRRHEFTSDNTAALCPEACSALQEANGDEAVPSYGDDQWTKRVCDRVRELFESDCDVYFAFNGTAANALALAQLCQPFHSVFCHEHAHIENDECGACEFFTHGSKLIPTRGKNGKLDLKEMKTALARQHELHSHKPRVISITQATELGTVYTVDEIGEISAFARERQMLLHMDGARFANALATLGCAPKDLTWSVGVDVLCFGGIKNGLSVGELVIFFSKERAQEFDYRTKQAGQLASKMRFVAAPWLALLTNDVWLRNARRANSGAQKLAEAIRRCQVEVIFPTEANAVFFRLDDSAVGVLREEGWDFYKFIEPDIYRLMCAWSVSDAVIEEFTTALKMARGCARRVP